MSDMAIDILGVPLTSDLPVKLTEARAHELKASIDELKSLGVVVTGVRIIDPDTPPRFFIAFVPGVPSFKARTAREMEGWDVGQQMGAKMLMFYAAKRAVKSNGWNDF